MAVVLSHGALFRKAAEGAIRRYLIEEKNWLDAVIGLPANIFYGTPIETCILVFKKCRETDDILFLDASNYFQKGKNQNVLGSSDIDRIVDGYRARASVDRFSHRATRAEIAENGYNLNIPRYVDTFVPPPPVDMMATAKALEVLRDDMGPVDDQIRAFCAELGLESPV